MAALNTVSDYLTAARVLLQDNVSPYRYPDDNLVSALNFSLLQARGIRPDLFLGRSDAVPSFSANDTTVVTFDQQYRVALLYYIVGHVQLVDEEDTQDQRAAAFIAKFNSLLRALQ